MLTTLQKIGMALALILSSCVLAMVSIAVNWENTPESQKVFILGAGKLLTYALIFCSSVYSLAFVYTTKQKKFIQEMTEYNKRMAEQFNVGSCISPRTWLDADDYRRLARGIRK